LLVGNILQALPNFAIAEGYLVRHNAHTAQGCCKGRRKRKDCRRTWWMV